MKVFVECGRVSVSASEPSEEVAVHVDQGNHTPRTDSKGSQVRSGAHIRVPRLAIEIIYLILPQPLVSMHNIP